MKTNEQYLKAPDRCPACNTNNIDAGAAEFDFSECRQEVVCGNPHCGFEWYDVYHLQSFVESTPPRYSILNVIKEALAAAHSESLIEEGEYLAAYHFVELLEAEANACDFNVAADHAINADLIKDS